MWKSYVKSTCEQDWRCEDFLNQFSDYAIILLIGTLAFMVYKKRHK